MNLRTTFILVLLAAGVGSLVWQREWVARKLGSVPPVETTTAENAVTLLPNVTADRITQVTIRVPGSTPLELAAKAPGQPLELPGNWPVRRNEVAELLATLTNLKSRFQAVPLSTPEVTENLGLTTTNNRAPITAELTTVNTENQQQTHRLTFGRPEAAADANPFLLPVYVRVNDDMVAYNVGQEILGVLNRPLDFYRKRQVFPETERLKIAENPRDAASAQPTFILNDQVKTISVQGPNGGYTLERVAPTPRPQPPIDKPTGDATLSAVALAESWVMISPVADRVDPVKLKNLLATIPDLWVDQFIINPDPLISLGAFNPFAFGANPGDALARFAGGVVESQYFGNAGPFLDLTGLKKPAMTLTLTLADGSSRSLLIGKVSRTNKRTEAAPPPMFPGQPPSPPKVIEEPVYFAKLPNTPLVFEIRGEKLGDVFFLQPKPEGPKAEPVAVAYVQLRDGNVVRFDTEQVKNVAIKTANQTLQLRKTKGDPKADSDAGRKDQWEVLAPFTGLAEAKQITDLLDPIDRLSAKPTEVIDRPALHAVVGSLGVIDLQAAGLTAEQGTTIELTSEVKTNTPVRQLIIGKHDAASKKMLAWSPATPNRISIVDDAAKTLIERHPRAYRSLKLFNLTDHRVESIQVTGGAGNFNLKEVIGTKKTYTLTEPVTVETDTDQSAKLLTDLAAMDISEFVYDPPTEAERNAIRAILGNTGDLLLNNATAAFGVDQPALSVTLNFAGSNPIAAKKLHIGKLRPGKPEYYARLEGSASVFTLKKEVPDVLLAGSLALLPTQLWNGSSDGLTVVEVTRGKDAPYTLKQTGSEWKLTAPYEAPLDVPAVIPMATAISAVKAERYAAHAPKTLAEYGLDQPALRVKFTLTERLVNKPGDNPKEITKERVLLIGKTDDAKGGRFAKLEGDSNTAVFVLNDKAFNDIDKPALELLNKKLLSLNPAAVTKLELTGPDGPITLEKQGADWKPVGAVFPVDKPTVEQIARYLTNLSVIKFAEYGPNIKLAPYGLDPAAKPITLKVSLGMETHTVEIGKVAEGTPNDRYVRVDNGNAIGILAVTTARDLSKSKLELADRTVFKFDPIDLQAIRRTMKVQELELVLETANWSITKPNKFPADQQTAEELADRLGALRADRIADIEGKDLPKFGLDQPEAILKIEMLGKGAKTIEKTLKIGKPVDPTKPDGERFAQADGASTVLVLSSFIAKKFLAEPLKFRERNLANFITADRATVTRGGKAITFEKVGGAWKLKPPAVGDIEEEALRELLDTLAKFRADEIVAEKPTDLKPYGLDNPDRWQWFNGDKEVLNLLVGGSEKVNNTATMRAYAKLEKSDLVVLLDMALSTKLRAEYRKRALWEPLDVATASAIIIDTVEGPGSFKLIKGPAGWIDPANPKDKIDTALVTEFLDAFAGLKADRYLETDPKEGTKIFGLDPAQKTITVSTQGNQSRTILLGRIDEQKRVYAQVQGKKEVSVLTPADTTKINRDRASFSTEKPEPKKVEEKKPEEKKPEPKKVEEKKPEEKKPEPKKVEEKKPEEKKPEPKKVEEKK